MSFVGKSKKEDGQDCVAVRAKPSVLARLMLTAGIIVPISLAPTTAASAFAAMQDSEDQAADEANVSQAIEDQSFNLIEQIETAAKERLPVIKSVDRQKRANEFSLRDPLTSGSNDAFKLRDSTKTTLRNQRVSTDSFLDRSASFPGFLSQGADASVVETSSLIGLRFAADPNRPLTTGVELALTSAMQLRPSTRPGASYSGIGQNDEFTDQFYDLGLRLGYWGFRIDATVVRQNNAYAGDYNGFGLGIGYNTSRFETSISLKAFTEGDHLAGINEVDQAIHDIEFGAAYRLTRSISLKGKVNYTRFNNRLLENQLGMSEQSVYLTGRLSF